MERLIEPLKQTCNTKVKTNSVKQEFEKQDELKRSALRALLALQKVPGVEKNNMLSEFISYIRSNNELSAMYAAIQKDGGGGAMSVSDHMDI